jgi:hypothetical protein
MKYKIDKTVPLPNRFKYPVLAMEVGDSFAVKGSAHMPHMCVYYNKVLAPKRFVTRRVEGGYRIWRVK